MSNEERGETASIPPFRRVVSGQAPDGRSVWTHVEDMDTLVVHGQPFWAQAWGWDEPPTLPYLSRAPYEPVSRFPGPDPGQLRVNMIVIPAGTNVRPRPPPDEGADAREAQRLLDARHFGLVMGDANGMHTTDTIDIAFVIAGEIVVATPDEEVTLRPGTVYVQNGAEHALRNRSDEPCTLGFVIIGARRR